VGPTRIFTIGHGTKPFDEFVESLKSAGIRLLVDVRTAPGSKRNPQYGRDSLERSLRNAGIEYRWMQELGGFRKPRPDSPNIALRNAAFRGYADHMETEGFREGLAQLERMAMELPTAMMCAESVWWRCHRRLLSDALAARGWSVEHLMPDGSRAAHVLQREARMQDGGVLVYDGAGSGDQVRFEDREGRPGPNG
jgi:uncharacterized protein (DUF488 family)